MSAKEAKARIKINKLLEDAGWRFFDNEFGPANIQVEANVKLSKTQIDALGDNFEKTKNGFVDFLLLDENGKPFIVLEAKSEDYDPLAGKEQARKYAKSQFVKYVILSNGNIHYFWNIYKGSPQVIITFPTYESVKESKAFVEHCIDNYGIVPPANYTDLRNETFLYYKYANRAEEYVENELGISAYAQWVF